MAETFDPYYTWLGIPPEDQPPDHYRLLGVRRFENNPEVISNALDQRMVHIRSFQGGPRAAASQQILNELSVAGACLTNAEKKGAYDRELRQKDAPKLGRTTTSGQYSKPAAAHKSGPIGQALPPSASPASGIPLSASSSGIGVAPAQPGGMAAHGAPFIGQPMTHGPAPHSPAPHSPAPHMPVPSASSPGIPVVVAKPAGAPGMPMPMAPGARASSVPWQPLVLLAAGGAAILFMGGVLLVAGLYAAGVFSPKKDSKVAQKPVTKTPIKAPDTEFKIKPPDNPPQRYPVRPPREKTPRPKPEPPPPTIPSAEKGPAFLLQSFKPETQNVSGSVKKFASRWTTEGNGCDLMMFPVTLPEEYVVETIVTRKVELQENDPSDKSGMVQGLVVGDRQCLVTVDGFNPQGTRTALDLIDGQRAGAEKDECEFRGKLLRYGRRTALKYYVYRDRLAVECDGKTVLDWKDGMSRLSLEPVFGDKIPDKKALFFGAWDGKFELARFDVRPMGLGEVPAAPAVPLASNTPKPPDEDLPSTPNRPPVAVAKLTPPDSEDKKKAELAVRSNFNIQDNLKPAEKEALAEKLLATAKTESAPATLFVLLDEARDLKVGAGDMEGAFLVVEKMVSSFEGDPWKLKLETLKDAAPKALQLQSKRELAHIGYRVALGAMAAANFEVAEEAADTAKVAAERSGDTAIKKDALELRIAADAAKKQQVVAQAAFEKLNATPDDMDANETWGRFACFTKRDWAEGLPYLAKGRDAALKEAAALDAIQPAANVDQVALAEKWWEVAKTLKAREQDSAQLRAREWYERALPGAGGLNKEKAQTRIKETDALYAKNTIPGPGVPIIPGATPGLVGRILLDSKDARVVARYTLGSEIEYDDVSKQLESKHNLKGRTIKIELAGILHLPETTEIIVRSPKNGSFSSKGSSSSVFGSSSQLFIGINNKENDIRDLAPNRDRDGSYKFSLPKGDYLFVWTIGGTRTGIAEIRFEDAKSNEPLFVYYNQKMESVYKSTYNNRPAPAIGELEFK